MLVIALPKEFKKGFKLPNRVGSRGPSPDSARLAHRRKAHIAAFHEGPELAELDVAGTRFSRGAFGNLGFSHSNSGCHRGLHSQSRQYPSAAQSMRLHDW